MRFTRCEQLVGAEALGKLKNSSVAVIGIGGVGGFAAEALARSGVGRLALVDKDVVEESNINRQIVALGSTVGRPKVEVMKQRILDINPEASVESFCRFYLPDNADFINLADYDYVLDAVDNVTAKIELIKRCRSGNIRIISAMGAGNKLDPSKLEIADISRTNYCPLAKTVRKKLSELGIKDVKVAYSSEPPRSLSSARTPASMMPVPASMGLLIAAEVIKDLIGG